MRIDDGRPCRALHPSCAPAPAAARLPPMTACMRLLAVVLLLGGVCYPQDEVDDDSQQQNDGQEGRAEAVVKPGLAADADRFGTPVICYEGVNHGQHGNAGKEEGADE